MSKNGLTRVVIFVLYKENKILLEKRPVKGFLSHQYLIPGGAILDEQLESIEDALKREMLEELGVIPLDYELLTDTDIEGVYNNILKPFVVSKWEGEIPKNVLDKKDPYPLEWIEIEEALTTPFEGSKKIIQHLKKYLLKKS